MKESLRGQFLLAMPALLDPNFRRAVVLLCEHSEEGALGIVVNRRSAVTLADALTHIPGAQEREDALLEGGPVQRSSVFILHDRVGLGGDEIVEDVYFGGDLGLLTALLDPSVPGPGQFRLFAGYAGWGAGQLEEEMGQGSWIPCPAEHRFVFHDLPAQVWAAILKEMGGRYALMAQAPIDPSMN